MSNLNSTYHVHGMTCASCVDVIENETKNLPGVKLVKVNFASETMYLEYSDEFISDLLNEKLESIGYKLIDPNSNDKSSNYFNKEFYSALIALIIGSIFMIFGMGPLSALIETKFMVTFQAIASLLVINFLGRPFINSVFSFFKTGKSNMNTLIGIGVLTSFIYSIFLVLTNWNHSAHIHVYFESVPFIVGFTLLGKFFDSKAKTKARSDLSSLYKMQLKFTSKVLTVDPVTTTSTPVKDLNLGDLIRILPGEKIPLEGEVVKGLSHADEALVSGESQAVVKNIGDKVVAGSLNLDGTLIIKIESVLKTTLVSSIIEYIEKAQSKKLEIEQIVDRVVKVFTPTILIIAFFTGFYWFLIGKSDLAVEFAIAVLLVACPCALGLAVPMAVLLATTESFKKGLFISGGDVFEKIKDIDTIIFDKTGTLTKGQAEVVSVDLNQKIDRAKFFTWILSLTEYSTHPLSKAISAYLKENKITAIDPDSFKNIPGGGIEGTIQGHKVKIGSLQFLNLRDEFKESELIGSLVYVSVDENLFARFVISDQIKPESIEIVKYLKQKYKIVMLSGDNLKTAKVLALKLGIDEFFAEVKPSGKSEFIEKLKNEGRKVAMIGDGVNDAMALSIADLSISMGNGSDIAIEASDITILDGKLDSVASFFQISNKTIAIIKSNLLLSFLYNFLAVPVAAGIFYNSFGWKLDPIFASVLMGISSISVVMNSLRIKGTTYDYSSKS